MSNTIRKALTRGESKASEVYFAVLEIQGRAAFFMLAIALAFGLGVRFIVRNDGTEGILLTIALTLVCYLVSCILSFWAIGHVLSLGDDSYKRRDRLGRYEANSLYVEKMMKHVETATEHRARGGQLVGYMVGGRYITLEKINEILSEASGVGGFSNSGGFEK